MSKYYRVRTQEQWDWLKNKLEIEDDLHVSYFPVTILCGDVFCGIYKYHDDPEPLIEVSQMMEGEKMEDYVTIQGEDLEKIKDDIGRDLIGTAPDGSHFANYDYDFKALNFPKSLLYPKVRMSVAEKTELNKLKNEMTACIYDLNDVLTSIMGHEEDYPLLYHRLYVADGDGVESQLDFARAWADESLIETIPDKKWNVYASKKYDLFWYKDDVEDILSGVAGSVDNKDSNQQFTQAEIEHYGLKDCEREEVKQ